MIGLLIDALHNSRTAHHNMRSIVVVAILLLQCVGSWFVRRHPPQCESMLSSRFASRPLVSLAAQCYNRVKPQSILRSVSSSQNESPTSSSVTSLKDVFRTALNSQPNVNDLNNRTLTIIDNPDFTLKQPYIGSALIDQWTDAIATSENPPGPKTNTLYVMLAGMGKGKTRFFVELEKALNQREGVFAVAITFSSGWIQKFDKSDDSMSIAVDVVLRMLTMTYSVAGFENFRKEFTKALRGFQSRQGVTYAELLQECAIFIVEDVQRSRPCKKFVLLLDEPKRLLEAGIAAGAFHDLRSALLDYEMPGFRISMATTALDLSTLGVSTTSNHESDAATS